MRLLKQQLRGITCFTATKPVVIDWDSYGEGIIAVIGPNGGGKSTNLEAAPMSLFEIAPSRGKGTSLYDIAHGRDAFIETLWEDNGDKLRVLIKIDAEKRKIERQFDVNGSKVASSAKDFAVEIEKRFGSKDLFLASVFMAQNRSGAFLQLEKVQRKELFAELLLLGRYEELAQVASLWQGASQKTLDDVRTRLSVLQSELEDLPAYEAHLAESEQHLDDTVMDLDAARLAENDARSALARVQRSQEHLAMLTTTRQACFSTWSTSEQAVTQATQIMADATARAQERFAAINARRTEEMEPAARNRHSIASAGLQGRRARSEALAIQQPVIEQAEAQLPGLSDERTNLDASVLEATLLSGRVQEKATEIITTRRRLEEIEAVRRRHEVYNAALDARHTRLEELASQMPEIVEAETVLAAIISERNDLAATVLAATNVAHRVESKSVELTAAERRVEERRKTIEIETSRLTRQTELLSEVPCTASETWIDPFQTPASGSPDGIPLAATCPLLKDARAASTELEALKNKGADPADEITALNAVLDTLKAEAATATAKADAARERQRTIASEETGLKEIVGRKFAANNAATDLKALAGERQHAEQQALVDITRLTQSTIESIEALEDSLGGISALFETLRAENDFILTILQQEHDALKEEQDRTAPKANADLARLQIVRGEIARLDAVLIKKDLVANAVAELANIDIERASLDDQLTRDLAAADEAVGKADHERQAVERDRTAAIESAGVAIKTATQERDAATYAFHKAESALSQAQAQIGDTAVLEQRLTDIGVTRERLETESRDINNKLAELRARIELLHRKQESQRQIEAEARIAEQEIGDWRMLAQAGGKDGVQALEIDAAGPEVARIANELLQSCYGPRFSITFETLREKITKPGEFSEAFDITVYDGGQERKVQLISGGEQVIIGRAIGLAVAIFNGQKNNVRYLDLFEDESVGALDQRQDEEGITTAQRYVMMLRQARLLGKFFQIRVIMHQPECYEMADIRLLVENGQVSIDRGGEALAA
jgi:DNA repair exonuclease SbcCD ATPase subunit